MGKYLSPGLRRELENLDKDADSRKSAMKALKSYVKDLDSKAIPIFLAQVSETKETGLSSGEYTISLYEVLARVHGTKIVPQIDSIMSTIIKTLTSSAGSFALHQACSKVVPAIARYGMDPTTPDVKKRQIIHSLCKPLSDSLLVNQENLSSGAALCLKALVDSDNWRYASSEIVNEVCQRVVGAMQRPMQANSHMGLVMALAKHNSLIVEAYARLLIHSGLGVLGMGVSEGNSQKRLSAIQMVNFLMKCLDPKSLISEINIIIEEMEKCQADQMAYVRGAAFEALQTAKRIATEKGTKHDREVSSITGSSFGMRSNSGRRNTWGSGDQSPLTTSPESQTVNSFGGYNSMFDSPFTISQVSQELDYDRRSVNRKLWRRSENGGVDVSLKDGLFSATTPRSVIENSEQGDFLENQGAYGNGFAGFLQIAPANGSVRSATPSPHRSRSRINIDNVKIFSTPRKLFHSLQDPIDVNSDFSEKQSRRFRSPCSSKFEWSPTSEHGSNHGNTTDENLCNGGEQFQGSSESVSSTEDIPAKDDSMQLSQELFPEAKSIPESKVRKSSWMSTHKMVCSLIVLLLALLVCYMSIGNLGQDVNRVVPT